MTLYNDDIAKIKEIAREVAKEEIEAMDTTLVDKLSTVVTDLEMEMKNLKAEMKRAKEAKDQSASETAKTAKKGVFK